MVYPLVMTNSLPWFFNFPHRLVNLLLSVILAISLPSTIHRSVHPLAINESMNNPLKFYPVLDVWPPSNKLIFPLIGFFPVFPINKIVDPSFTSPVWENHDPMVFLNIFPQWIGFVGKIWTGNHRFSHEDHGVFRFKFSQQNQSIDSHEKWMVFPTEKAMGKPAESHASKTRCHWRSRRNATAMLIQGAFNSSSVKHIWNNKLKELGNWKH